MKNVQEIPRIQVYGHTARIFRCKVLKKAFITAGEDSILNIWSHQGRLLRKIETHQGGPIWALDCDEVDNRLVTGGGDGGVTVFPIKIDDSDDKLFIPDGDKPKLMGILSSNNLAVVSERGTLYYCEHAKNRWVKIDHFEDMKSYILLQISHCRNLIALAGKIINIRKCLIK